MEFNSSLKLLRELFEKLSRNFDVLLTVQHLSIFTLVINQLDAQNLFYNNFIFCSYLFRAPCARDGHLQAC